MTYDKGLDHDYPGVDVGDQSQAAFNRAIRTGRLTEMSARDYMFMGFDAQGRGCFKHRDTRQYLAHQPAFDIRNIAGRDF